MSSDSCVLMAFVCLRKAEHFRSSILVKLRIQLHINIFFPFYKFFDSTITRKFHKYVPIES